MLQPAKAIELYIRAKDHHEPALMAQAFDPGAMVSIDAQTDAIRFPPELSGLNQIEQVLVTDFALAWQDVRTFCFRRPGDLPLAAFTCQWMVAMRSRHGDGARLGYGVYHWLFSCESGQVTGLKIRIDEMMLVNEQQASALVGWATQLPYPWCQHQALRAKPNAVDVVDAFLDRLLESA